MHCFIFRKPRIGFPYLIPHAINKYTHPPSSACLYKKRSHDDPYILFSSLTKSDCVQLPTTRASRRYSFGICTVLLKTEILLEAAGGSAAELGGGRGCLC